ncbi:hypothetical protein [Taibaiella chishuiensis]|uniref:Uncharacterized protein n=1 Tax=Taibaiella chishuiensis TaxID=1434707 RepID=A0A2P8D0X4_9BACT|nr:hypothetical protein [Taibaiella chishuiensis]PSK90868.1 hypothetical protein B0I18_107280 [Taibaiella chishuiensis]
MNYQILCFHSLKGIPDLIEALEVLDSEEHFRTGGIQTTKKELANKILELNSGLYILRHDYDEIASYQGISTEEARARFDFIQIHSQETIPGISMILFDTIITVDIPFKSFGQNHDDILIKVKQYLKLILKETGYFAFDAEAEIVYSYETLGSLKFNLLRAKGTIPQQAVTLKKEKSWWKFW